MSTASAPQRRHWGMSERWAGDLPSANQLRTLSWRSSPSCNVSPSSQIAQQSMHDAVSHCYSWPQDDCHMVRTILASSLL